MERIGKALLIWGQVIRLLLEHQADVMMRNCAGHTCVTCRFISGCSGSVIPLPQRGADPEIHRAILFGGWGGRCDKAILTISGFSGDVCSWWCAQGKMKENWPSGEET